LNRIDRTVFDALDRYRQDAAVHYPRITGSSVLRFFSSSVRQFVESLIPRREGVRTEELKNR
jgi:hypothetical protein